MDYVWIPGDNTLSVALRTQWLSVAHVISQFNPPDQTRCLIIRTYEEDGISLATLRHRDPQTTLILDARPLWWLRIQAEAEVFRRAGWCYGELQPDWPYALSLPWILSGPLDFWEAWLANWAEHRKDAWWAGQSGSAHFLFAILTAARYRSSQASPDLTRPFDIDVWRQTAAEQDDVWREFVHALCTSYLNHPLIPHTPNHTHQLASQLLAVCEAWPKP